MPGSDRTIADYLNGLLDLTTFPLPGLEGDEDGPGQGGVGARGGQGDVDLEAPESTSPRFRVLTDPADPVAADLEQLARGFVDYALGDTDLLPVAVTVEFSLGGEVSQHIDDIVAGLPNRKIWQFCPGDWEIYGAISCPVDALGPVKTAAINGTRLVLTGKPDDVTCAPERTGPLPQGRLVVIRPEGSRRTCTSDFSLALGADDDGRLTAIDLTLADP